MDLDIHFTPDIERQTIPYFEKYKGLRDDYWYVGMNDSPANQIFHTPPERETKDSWQGFRGFGGRTLSFMLKDGTVDKVEGPWHVSADALYRNTGVDVRRTYYTWGCIAEGREDSIYRNVIYRDDLPSRGSFNRIPRYALTLCRQLNMPLYVYIKSYGGTADVIYDPWETLEV